MNIILMPWEEAGITEEQYRVAVEEEYLDQLERVREMSRKNIEFHIKDITLHQDDSTSELFLVISGHHVPSNQKGHFAVTGKEIRTLVDTFELYLLEGSDPNECPEFTFQELLNMLRGRTVRTWKDDFIGVKYFEVMDTIDFYPINEYLEYLDYNEYMNMSIQGCCPHCRTILGKEEKMPMYDSFATEEMEASYYCPTCKEEVTIETWENKTRELHRELTDRCEEAIRKAEQQAEDGCKAFEDAYAEYGEELRYVYDQDDKIVGECDDCGHHLTMSDQIPSHPSIFGCSKCGHPTSLKDRIEDQYEDGILRTQEE